MTVRARIVALIYIGGLLFVSTAARVSLAADQEATLQQITALNKGAIAAYSAGSFDKSKSQLLQAVALAKKDSELQAHPLMARTYLHLGVLYVDGFEDRAAGVRYFVKALKIRPDIELNQSLATKTAKSAFDEARGEEGGGEAVAGETPRKKPPVAAKAAAAAAADDEAEAEAEDQPPPSKKLTAAEKRKAADEEKRAAAEESRATAEESRAAAEGKSKLMKELAQAEGNEAKERGKREKLQAEKVEKEKLLADTKASLDQLQKEKKEVEKQAQAEKEKLTKELAQVRESEAKERAAKEKLQTEKAEKEKLLADAKGAIQQLQKEKADKEKQLADTTAREKKERETKEKVEKEKQLADAREKERKDHEEKERANREKLAAGPDLPARIPEPLYCAIPDEAQAGSELFVHCAPRSDVKAKVIAIYYRPSGALHYNSLAMEPSKKGWYAAVIPADKVTGKVLQYYAEARDGGGGVAAATGKAASPNILTLRSGSATPPPTTTAGRSAPRSR